MVEIDNSAVQLATAHRLQREYGLVLTLIHGNAEQVPYPDARFDLAVSEYGVSLWADPYRGVPEVARILRPVGGDPEGPAARSSVGAPQEHADSPTSARG